MKRKLVSCLLSLALLASSSNVALTNVESYSDSKEYVCMNNDIPNLLSDYDQDSYLCQKLENDKKVHSTSLRPDIERKLNEMGWFDEEMKGLSEKDILALESSEEIYVNVNYSEYDEECNERKLSVEDINDTLKQQASARENRTETNSFTKALKKLGLAPIKAYAKVSDSSTVTRDSGKLKSIITITYNKKTKQFHVIQSFNWIKEPKHTAPDLMCLYADSDMVFVRNSMSATHTVTKTTEKYRIDICGSSVPIYKGTTVTTQKTNPTAFSFSDDSRNCAVLKVNLFTDYKTYHNYADKGEYSYFVTYSDDKTVISYDVTFKKPATVRKGDIYQFTSKYYHQEYKSELNPSISVDSKGVISLSCSPSFKTVYKKLDNQPYIDYKMTANDF